MKQMNTASGEIVVEGSISLADASLSGAEIVYLPSGEAGREAAWRLKAKRAFDLVFSAVLLVVCAPLMALIAAAIKLEGGGPVFFVQERLGLEGRVIRVLKFRTMHVDAQALLLRLLESDEALREEYEVYHKLRRDPRITRIGYWLRKTSLDEIPQILNVFRGDMSIVGPRPYIPQELEAHGSARDLILSVKPGITGLWQATKRNSCSFEERVQIDCGYVRDWSLTADLRILGLTAVMLLDLKSAH